MEMRKSCEISLLNNGYWDDPNILILSPKQEKLGISKVKFEISIRKNGHPELQWRMLIHLYQSLTESVKNQYGHGTSEQHSGKLNLMDIERKSPCF